MNRLILPFPQAAISTGPTACNITFWGAGVMAHGTTSCAPAVPSNYQANDIFLLFAICTTGKTISTPNGYTLIVQNDGGSDAKNVAVFYKRATASESAPTVSASGASAVDACLVAYRGCIATGSPVDVASSAWSFGSGTSNKVVTVSAITTVTAYDMVVLAAMGGSSQSGETWTWQSGFSATKWTDNDYDNNAFMSAGSQEVFATAGTSTGNCTATSNKEYSKYLSGILIALKTS